MNRVSAIGLLACVTLLGGCTAISDFGRYMFGPGGGPDGGVDGGMIRNDGGDEDGGRPDGGDEEDGGVADGSVDAAVDAQIDAGFDAGPRIPTGVVQTSGGAVIVTPAYQLRVSVGAPQPMGSVESSAHRLRVGPQPR